MVEQDHYGDYYLMEVVLVVDHYQAILDKEEIDEAVHDASAYL